MPYIIVACLSKNEWSSFDTIELEVKKLEVETTETLVAVRNLCQIVNREICSTLPKCPAYYMLTRDEPEHISCPETCNNG